LFLQVVKIDFHETIINQPITSTRNSYLVFSFGNCTIDHKEVKNITPLKHYITPIDNPYLLYSEKGVQDLISKALGVI
jgi:hypothetical protein